MGDGGGEEQMTFTLTVKRTPFFDKRSGSFYNLQSVGMVVLPLCCALGCYLGIFSHMEVRRSLQAFMPREDAALVADLTRAEQTDSAREGGNYGSTPSAAGLGMQGM